MSPPGTQPADIPPPDCEFRLLTVFGSGGVMLSSGQHDDFSTRPILLHDDDRGVAWRAKSNFYYLADGEH
jgi:hypothetical protein